MSRLQGPYAISACGLVLLALMAAAPGASFAQEPPVDEKLLNLTNFLVTPHIGGSAKEAILAMGRAAIEGLDKNAIP